MRLGPAFQVGVPVRAIGPVKALANRPDTAGRTSGTGTGRAPATLARRASICTRGPQFENRRVSSIYIPYGVPAGSRQDSTSQILYVRVCA